MLITTEAQSLSQKNIEFFLSIDILVRHYSSIIKFLVDNKIRNR